MAENCTAGLKNIGATTCNSDYGVVTGLILDLNNTGISLANAITKTNWITKLNAAKSERTYIIIPKSPKNVTRNLEDPIIETGNTGVTSKIRDGKVNYVFELQDITTCQKRRLKSFDNIDAYGYFVTSKGHILSDGDGTNLIPVKGKVSVSEIMTGETYDNANSLMVTFFIEPTEGYFDYNVDPVTNGDFNPSDLRDDAVKDVEFTTPVGTIASDEITVTVTTACDGAEVSDLTDVTDWACRVKSTGVAVSLVSIAPPTLNNYTITTGVGALTAVEHELYLINQPAMTIKGFELQEADIPTFTPA